MGDDPGLFRIADIKPRQPPAPPGPKGEVTSDECVMQRIASTCAPLQRLAATTPHAWKPAASNHMRLARVGHVDDGNEMIWKKRKVNGSVGVTAADIPDTMRPYPLHRHKADLGWLLRL